MEPTRIRNIKQQLRFNIETVKVKYISLFLNDSDNYFIECEFLGFRLIA